MPAGKAAAVADTIGRITSDAAEQAAGGDITPELADLLAAIRDRRVVSVGGRWVIDVSWPAKVAIRAGLAGRADRLPDGRTLLDLTGTGRATVTRIWAGRAMADMLRLALAHRAGRAYAERVAAEQAEQEEAARPSRRLRLWRRAAAQLVCAAGVFAAGAVTAYLIVRPTGH